MEVPPPCQYHAMVVWILVIIEADENDRPAPLMVGEKGKILEERVWNEIVEALEKDVPEIRQMIHS